MEKKNKVNIIFCLSKKSKSLWYNYSLIFFLLKLKENKYYYIYKIICIINIIKNIISGTS